MSLLEEQVDPLEEEADRVDTQYRVDRQAWEEAPMRLAKAAMEQVDATAPEYPALREAYLFEKNRLWTLTLCRTEAKSQHYAAAKAIVAPDILGAHNWPPGIPNVLQRYSKAYEPGEMIWGDGSSLK